MNQAMPGIVGRGVVECPQHTVTLGAREHRQTAHLVLPAGGGESFKQHAERLRESLRSFSVEQLCPVVKFRSEASRMLDYRDFGRFPIQSARLYVGMINAGTYPLKQNFHRRVVLNLHAYG